MNCPICDRDRVPFVNKPDHELYGMCEECFNIFIEPKRNYNLE